MARYDDSCLVLKRYAPTDADVRIGRRRRAYRSTQMSASVDADGYRLSTSTPFGCSFTSFVRSIFLPVSTFVASVRLPIISA